MVLGYFFSHSHDSYSESGTLSHSVSLEFLHSQHFASCLDSDEPEAHGQGSKKQEDEQSLGQNTEGSGGLLQRVARI